MKTLLLLIILSAGVCSAQRYATDTQLASEAATRSTADAGKAGTGGQGVVASSFRTALGLATNQSPTWAGILGTPISGGTGSFTTLAASGTTSLALTSISSPAFPPLDVIRATAGTTGILGTATFTAASTGDVVDGFGSNISLGISDSGVARTSLGTIAAVRAGADNTGNLVLSTTQSGTPVEALRIINGKVLIGSATDAGAAKLQVTGNGSFTGTLSVTGQTQLGASQSLTNGQSAVSRDLADARFGKKELVPFNVTDYGADNTGASDSSSAIAAAFMAASGGNRRVHFPRGIYKFNYTLTNAMSTGHWRITGDGGGAVGDWTGGEPAGATLLKPNNNSLPVFTFEFLRGVSIEGLEIRGNGAGVSTNGMLVDNPAANFAGNGFFAHNVTIRAFTNGFNSIGACNVVFRESVISNNNFAIKIPNLPFAHSYRFEQCSLGGVATVLGGSGTSRILDIADGSFVDFLGCEMGNCTDMISTAITGAAVINVIGGNMESMSAPVLNIVKGGTFNMRGVRIGTGNKTVVRGDGGAANITGINLEDNLAAGAMTMYDHNGFSSARLAGNGLNKSVSAYDSGFTTLLGTSVCENLVVSARLTADQVIASAGTNTVIYNVEAADIGSKYNPTTAEFTPGKAGRYLFSAGIDVNSGTASPHLGVYINGSLRATLGQWVTAGGGVGTFVNGSQIVAMNPSDVATIRVVTGAGMTIRTNGNYASMLSILELPYF